MNGYHRERWDRTQATFFVTLIAVIGSILPWSTLAILGALT